MAGWTVVTVLDVLYDSVCHSHHELVGSGDDETTLLDISTIKLKGATVDSNGLATGGLRPLGIKLLKMKGSLSGNFRLTMEAKAALAANDQYLQSWEQNADAELYIDEDWTTLPNGGLKCLVSETANLEGTTWDPQANVTADVSTTVRKVGANSSSLEIAAGFTTGLIASDEQAAINITGYDGVGFWIRSTVALQPSDLSFLVDETASCASPDETLPIEIALAADEWKWVELRFKDPTILNAVVSLGLRANRDFGAATLYIDGIRFKKFANNAVSTAVNDLVVTSSGGASGDFGDLDIWFELIWGPDSSKGVLV